ncbi:MAG: Lysine exporter protein LysE/YggA [Nitrosopumilales archaeon]|nr:MAG: Lysine exporter protein LysE/YggA [Nitrosopumilales archaeon]
MEELLGFAVAVIIISTSGVMSPGPLFVANVVYGAKGGASAGLKMSYGHTVVELPLIILLGLSALSLETIPQFRIIIAILGSIGLFLFAGIQIKSVFKSKTTLTNQTKYSPFFAGILFSALNPFFIIWWFTIGFKLISDSLFLWSFWGIAILFALHIWMDYAWLTSTAYLSSRGSRFLSNKNYRFFIFGLSLVLIYFGITFITDVISS